MAIIRANIILTILWAYISLRYYNLKLNFSFNFFFDFFSSLFATLCREEIVAKYIQEQCMKKRGEERYL